MSAEVAETTEATEGVGDMVYSFKRSTLLLPTDKDSTLPPSLTRPTPSPASPPSPLPSPDRPWGSLAGIRLSQNLTPAITSILTTAFELELPHKGSIFDGDQGRDGKGNIQLAVAHLLVEDALHGVLGLRRKFPLGLIDDSAAKPRQCTRVSVGNPGDF